MINSHNSESSTSISSNEVPQESIKERSIGRKRKKILNEIYETEKTYQYHLMLLTTLFLEPIKVSSVLTPRLIDGIFSNIEAIQSVSSHLLESMEEQGVAHALLELAPFMKLYSLYANNFDNANKLLEEQQVKNPDFARLLKFQESREEMQSLRFSALLVTPIQRVPRYRLLLENLLSKTFEYDPDFSKLKDAFEKISKVATHINECVRQHENFHKMLSIQNSFTGSTAPKILAPGRYFIREGVVTKISERGRAKEKTLFLFNDLLLCAKKETSCTYRCCDIYPLVNCIIEQVMGNQSNGNGLFKIICKEKSMLLCSKFEQKSWSHDIKHAVSQLHSNLASLKRTDYVISSSVPQDLHRFQNKKSSSVKGLPSTISSAKLKRLPDLARSCTMQATSSDLQKRWTCPSIDANGNYIGDANKPSFSFSEDTFHKLTCSIDTEKSSIMDEKSSKKRSESASSQKANWTLTESSIVESRRPLHALTNGAKKLGCSSTKRKQQRQDQRNSLSPYSKEKSLAGRKAEKTGNLESLDFTNSRTFEFDHVEVDIKEAANNNNGCALM